MPQPQPRCGLLSCQGRGSLWRPEPEGQEPESFCGSAPLGPDGRIPAPSCALGSGSHAGQGPFLLLLGLALGGSCKHMQG